MTDHLTARFISGHEKGGVLPVAVLVKIGGQFAGGYGVGQIDKHRGFVTTSLVGAEHGNLVLLSGGRVTIPRPLPTEYPRDLIAVELEQMYRAGFAEETPHEDKNRCRVWRGEQRNRHAIWGVVSGPV